MQDIYYFCTIVAFILFCVFVLPSLTRKHNSYKDVIGDITDGEFGDAKAKEEKKVQENEILVDKIKEDIKKSSSQS